MQQKTWTETADEAKARFVTELEFVQCLSNPGYLAHLAATRVLFTPEFVAYLEVRVRAARLGTWSLFADVTL
jgi:hypothetical protein